ncbi:MAG: AAA family ATPase [Candidatus Lokiarchaeota archaeon]|nr:AAA family ATPase [Candidatus Lokiarchaeota archaeon]
MTQLPNFLVILSGLPASGKSTIALNLRLAFEGAFLDREVKIVDIDKIRTQITGNHFDPEKEKVVREESLNKVFSLLKNGNIVISDDLNYYSSMRHDLKAIVDKLNLPAFTIHVATTLETCLEWNEKRDYKIPSDLITSISEKFDAFDKYAWDDPLATIDPSKIKDMKPWIQKVIDLITSRLTHFQGGNGIYSRKESTSNIKKESLDRITRQIVNELLKDPEKRLYKSQILKLRKKFVKSDSGENFNLEEIKSKFKAFLSNNFNGKGSIRNTR